MDSDILKKTNILKIIFKTFLFLFFIFSLLYLYWIDWNKISFFSENNKLFSILYLVLLFYSLLYFVSFHFSEDIDIYKFKKKFLKISFTQFACFFLFLVTLILFSCSIINSYCRFFLIIFNISTVFIFFFSSNKYLINLIKYTVKRKLNYFLPVFLFCLV